MAARTSSLPSSPPEPRSALPSGSSPRRTRASRPNRRRPPPVFFVMALGRLAARGTSLGLPGVANPWLPRSGGQLEEHARPARYGRHPARRARIDGRGRELLLDDPEREPRAGRRLHVEIDAPQRRGAFLALLVRV